MLTAKLRKVGGSVMLAVPPAILDMLRLRANATVALSIEGGRLVVESPRKQRYTLAELLAQCDPNVPLPPEEHDWLDSAPMGRELL